MAPVALPTIFTIGHSTRTLEELMEILGAHGIRTLVDIRAYPASRRMPWFRGPQHPPFIKGEEAVRYEALETTLPRAGIQYVWMRELGGRRRQLRAAAETPNVALHSPAFRNYADYMLTDAFAAAIEDLLQIAAQAPTAIMCAEAQVYWHCHRMLVSDYLTAHRQTVLHIRNTAPAQLHRMTPEARIEGGCVIYDGGTLPLRAADSRG